MTDGNRPTVIGIIGGSGIYDIEGLTNKRWKRVQSPSGKPSDELLFGELNGQKMVFLPPLRDDDKATTCGCRSALEYALITAPDARDPEMIKRLDTVAGRLLNSC